MALLPCFLHIVSASSRPTQLAPLLFFVSKTYIWDYYSWTYSLSGIFNTTYMNPLFEERFSNFNGTRSHQTNVQIAWSEFIKLNWRDRGCNIHTWYWYHLIPRAVCLEQIHNIMSTVNEPTFLQLDAPFDDNPLSTLQTGCFHQRQHLSDKHPTDKHSSKQPRSHHYLGEKGFKAFNVSFSEPYELFFEVIKWLHRVGLWVLHLYFFEICQLIMPASCHAHFNLILKPLSIHLFSTIVSTQGVTTSLLSISTSRYGMDLKFVPLIPFVNWGQFVMSSNVIYRPETYIW